MTERISYMVMTGSLANMLVESITLIALIDKDALGKSNCFVTMTSIIKLPHVIDK